MGLINVIDVPTQSGVKTIEVHQGDLTKTHLKIDVLLISAFPYSYWPTEGTLIKSLQENCGISVYELSKDPLLDARESMNCWFSKRIDSQQFKYIGCVENIDLEADNIKRVYDNLFAALSFLTYKDPTIKTIALPILGAGRQNPRYRILLPPLIEKAIQVIRQNATLSGIYFVEKRDEKVQGLDEELNRCLNRTNENLQLVEANGATKQVLDEVLKKLVRIQDTNTTMSESDTLDTLINSITSKSLRAFELGILSRKLIEVLLSNLLDSMDDQQTLYDSIVQLKSKKVNDWMLTYLHTIRIFGNSVAHESKKGIPTKMNETDVVVLIYALNRALDLTLDHEILIKSSK